MAQSGLTRGAIVVVAPRCLYRETASRVVVQADLFHSTHASITVCPITSDCIDAPLFRVNLPPGERTGLSVMSQVMVDKLASVPRTAIAREIGTCDVAHVEAIDDALRTWLAL